MSTHLSTARRGTIVLAGAQAAKVGVHFSGLVILSRLLGPSHLGHLALLAAVVALGDLLRESTLTLAAVQAPRVTRGQATNLFWLNTGMGAAMAAVVVAASGGLAHLLHVPALADTLPWAALSLLILGFQGQFQVQLIRDGRIGLMSWTDVVSQALGLLGAVALALADAPTAAIVCQVVAVPAVVMVLRVAVTPWRPGLPRRGQGTTAFLRYGSTLALAQGLTFASNNLDRFLIAARLSLHDVGVYSRSVQLLNLPVSQFMAPLVNVVLPMLATLRARPREYWSFLRQFQLPVAAVMVCGLAIAIPTAEAVFGLVLGAGWDESAKVFQILAVGGCFQILAQTNFWVFLSLESASHLLKFSLVTRPLTVLAVVVGSSFGLEATALAYSGSLVVSWCVGLVWLQRVAGMPAPTFLADGMALITAGVVAGGVTALVRDVLPAAGLAIHCAAGVAAFACVLGVLPRTRPQTTVAWRRGLAGAREALPRDRQVVRD